MGWLIALIVIFLLAILPLGACVLFNEDGPLVKIIAGPIRLRVFPAKPKDPDKPPKEKKSPKANKPSPEADEKTAKKKKDKKNGGSVTDFIPFVQLGLNFLGDFRRKLRVDRLELNVILAGGDPADLAINYGKAWTALGNLWPRLETWFVIKKRDVEIQCDFEGSATTVYARLDITITIGRILALAAVYGVRALKEYLQLRKKRNGGTKV